jgi:hypothetical protein
VKPIQDAYYERYPDKIEILLANIEQIYNKMHEFHEKKESNFSYFPSADKFLTYYFAFYIHDVFPLYKIFFQRHLDRQDLVSDRYSSLGAVDNALRDLILVCDDANVFYCIVLYCIVLYCILLRWLKIFFLLGFFLRTTTESTGH